MLALERLLVCPCVNSILAKARWHPVLMGQHQSCPLRVQISLQQRDACRMSAALCFGSPWARLEREVPG